MRHPPTIAFTKTYADDTDFDWSDFDVNWFCQINNADVARARLEFMSTPGNIYKLMQHGYGGAPIERMWKSVLRAAIGFGVPFTATQQHLAREHGIVF